MNKLITTNNGGFPFQLDDIRFLDSGFRDAINNLFSNFSDGSNAQSFIVSGCQISISGSTISVTEGWLYLGSEVVHFPAASIDTSGYSVFYFGIVTNDTESRVFEDGNSYDVHQTRQAQLQVSAVSSIGSMEVSTSTPFVARRLDQLIANKASLGLATEQESVKYVGAVGQPSFGASASVTGVGAKEPLGFWKDSQGNVHVQGYFRNTAQWATIFTLPSDYRPANQITLSLHAANSVGNDGQVGILQINGDGTVVAGMPVDSANTISTNDVVVITGIFKAI